MLYICHSCIGEANLFLPSAVSFRHLILKTFIPLLECIMSNWADTIPGIEDTEINMTLPLLY